MADSIYVPAVVLSRREVSPDSWVVRLAAAERIVFLPGQYIAIGMPDGAHMVERPYSIASSPRERWLEFFVELVPEGKLTPQLYNVPVGGRVMLRRQAKGRFLFDRESGHSQHFMVASVTGVAPFLSMLRDLASAQAQGGPMRHRITLLHSASTPIGFGYRDELAGYAHSHPWFRYIPTVSRIWEAPEWRGEVGRAEDVLRKHLDAQGFAAVDTTVYLCGNPRMIENARGVTMRAGFGREFIKEEQYWPEAA